MLRLLCLGSISTMIRKPLLHQCSLNLEKLL
nr:MAG TPA: Ectatomin [Caudoviricetes sp.]